ncbi:MAG: acyltransferase [Haliea sp.]
MQKSGKFLYLESLRGLAAITVVLYHGNFVGHSSFLGNNYFVKNGELMVDFFFVLSGFVISYNYFDRIVDFASLVRFQMKRFLRLYPLHFATLILFAFGFEFLEYLKEMITGQEGNFLAFSNFDDIAFLNNLFLTQGLFEDRLTFNSPSWSISTEFYTYAVFGLIFLFISNEKSRIIASVSIVIMSGCILYFYDAINLTTGLVFFRCTYAFFIGVLVHYLFQYKKIKLPLWVLIFSLFISVISIIFGKQLSHFFHPFIFATMIVSLLWTGQSKLKNVLDSPKLVYLGSISYGIYMIHAAVWWILNKVLQVVFKYQSYTDDATGNTFLHIGPVAGGFVLIIGVSITIFLARLSYEWIEMPAYKYRYRISD